MISRAPSFEFATVEAMDVGLLRMQTLDIVDMGLVRLWGLLAKASVSKRERGSREDTECLSIRAQTQLKEKNWFCYCLH